MDNYSITEAAKALEVNYTTVRRAIKAGKLKAHKVDGKWMIPQDSIIAYMQERGKKGKQTDRATAHQSTGAEYALIEELRSRVRFLEDQVKYLQEHIDRLTGIALPSGKARDTRGIGERIREWFTGARYEGPGSDTKKHKTPGQ